MKLELAQYRELAAFAQFGTTELDKATRAQLERGQRITEILKQPLYKPVAMEKQVMILYAAINGLLDDVPLTKMREFEDGLYKFMEAGHPEVGQFHRPGKRPQPRDLGSAQRRHSGIQTGF